ncbi:hypothetical protein [Candidatus Pelagibacter sp. HIMB1506]|uniref:hypothetical protein n=1 Tax=Candidatus Pelagibacter sp. HIMB1506 TaxID=3413337 RepID=UPI003F8270B2
MILNKLSSILIVFLLVLSTGSKAESYLYGGPKIFYYDVTNEDLQSTANEIVALGFSSAKVSANTAGIGFDIGIGGPISENVDLEAGFVYMGEFELKATMTGPSETLTSTSSAYSFPVGAKYKIGESDSNLYIKGGFHYWKQVTDISTSLGTVDMWGTGFDPMIGIGGQIGNLTVHYEHYSFSGVGAGAGVGEGGISSLGLTWISKF